MKVTIHYASDLTEMQWQFVRKFIPKQKTGRTPIDRRRIINFVGCWWYQKQDSQ